MPIVEMWELGSNPLDMLVGFSHTDVGRAQTRHLAETRRRNIAFIGARMTQDRRAAQRAAGYRETVEDAGLGPPVVIDIEGPASTTTAGETFGRLIEERPETDGVVFSNDILALGAVFEAERRGLALPERVAIIGFGDLDFGRGSFPRLSTVRPPGARIGETAASMLLARIDGAPEVADTTDLGFELVPRESSAPSRDARTPAGRAGG
jgi:LacI family gluconate utilization system Gnt-I transcriptional repressor